MSQQNLITIPGIGIDIGGVLTKLERNNHGVAFRTDDYLEKPFLPQAIEKIAELVELFGPERSVLVSFCGKKTQDKTLEWLLYQNFSGKTKMPKENFRFVNRREKKAEVAIKTSLTHFIDDRTEILGYLTMVPNRYWFLGGVDEKPTTGPDGIILINQWSDLHITL